LSGSAPKRLEGKSVLLGVTGSIAAYKACEVLRALQREGADVRVLMTEAARRFVAPLTFETLSGHEVITELFPDHRTVTTRHIAVAEWADCILVCPATANAVGKAASGIADDFLSTVILAARSRVVFAPAMDFRMVTNPVYLENCRKLISLGFGFVQPQEGHLASGATGSGRLADTDSIMDGVRSALLGSSRLSGRLILVTAGPTREPVDPVRCLTNRSSGKMGFALAESAALRGASVTLVAGPVPLHPFMGIKTVRVETAAEMAEAILSEWPSHDALVMAAAVADFRLKKNPKNKIKKSDTLTLELEATRDILSACGRNKGARIAVGFALETENGVENAREKLQSKNLDLICLNDPSEPGSGFDSDTNRVICIDRDGKAEEWPLLPKWSVSDRIMDRLESLFGGNGV
jgi:phosphopantothenoylcysteine decarboxylase/phosphopantothenate--cysteine ligase